jgi:hypothetical protein
MRENINPLFKILPPGLFRTSGTESMGLSADPAFGEGRRSSALFFACHLDYFIMTDQFAFIYRDRQKKRHRDTLR